MGKLNYTQIVIALIVAVAAYAIVHEIKGVVAMAVANTPDTPIATSNLKGYFSDNHTREQVAAYCECWSVAAPTLTNLGQYREADRIAATSLKSLDKLGEVDPKFNAAVRERLEKAAGTTDPASTNVQAIANEMAAIAKELRD